MVNCAVDFRCTGRLCRPFAASVLAEEQSRYRNVQYYILIKVPVLQQNHAVLYGILQYLSLARVEYITGTGTIIGSETCTRSTKY